MTKAANRGIVRITIKRRFHYPYDVFVTRHENEGFGFVIISSSSQTYGSIIGEISLLLFLNTPISFNPKKLSLLEFFFPILHLE